MTTHTLESVSTMRRWLALRPHVADVLLVCALIAFGLMLWAEQGSSADSGTIALALLLVFAQTVPLAWRRSFPWTVLAVVGVAYLLYEAIAPVIGYSDGLFVAFAGYAVARYAPAPGSAVVSVVIAAAVVGPDLIRTRLGVPPAPEPGLNALSVLMIAAMTWGLWLLGTAQRRTHADTQRLYELAERLRTEQEISTRHAAMAERARIARDLHEVVAHHVSVIAMQARSTAETLPDEPGLATIGSSADMALAEMRRMVGLLTDGDEGEPQPSLLHLDQLAATARSAGCQVEIAVPSHLAAPAAVQVSAYRIVQEALTNVLKHAGVTVIKIRIWHRGHALSVEVVNGPPAPGHQPPPRSGRGLIGMSERASLFHGSLSTGPTPTGGWRVEALLTWQER
ncbi:histidine kinase [Streptomyces sp. NPDC048057]|uniref:sensor histidine kinase n=1 Tax=Streptomyces sp. NPDC048057 TaxID=3155628 RepID=UPI0033C38C31